MKRLLILLMLLPGVALAADNIDVTSGTGNTVAFDDIGGTKHQRVKVVLGADGTSDGDVSSANPMPVVITAGTAGIGKLTANSGVDIGDVDVTSLPALATGTNVIGEVKITDGTDDVAVTAGGLLQVDIAGNSSAISLADTSCTAYRNVALAETAVAVKASAGKVKRYYVFNPDTAVCMVQLYNVAAASVTVGTTTPTMTIPLPAGAAANDSSMEGWNFDTAVAIAATTTATGSTACGANLIVNLCYD